MAIEVLGELRQECTLCGGSCQGVFVALIGDEKPRIEALAVELGVPDPIVDGRLRREQGSCAFLGEDRLCRIHAAHGPAAKPHICRQYPMVALAVEGGVRVGIDPGCFTHIHTWRSAELVENTHLVPSRVDLAPQEAHAEEALLNALDGARLADGLHMLTGEAPTDEGGPGPAFSARLWDRLVAADLGQFLDLEEASPANRAGLAPLMQCLRDHSAPPAWSLDPELEAFAVDAVRRMLFLRLANGSIPIVPAAALLSLSGAVAMAWATSDTGAYGRGLAAWMRIIRMPPLWRAITPDSAALQDLARG